MTMEKITAVAAPPGHSLTDRPGQWPWERPPQFTNPDEALDFVLDKLEEPTRERDMLRLMAAGISIEELVSQIAFKGFMSGFYTPDVAELIKPSIGIYLYHKGLEEGLEPRMLMDPNDEEGIEEGEVDDVSFFRILKQRNPELFEAMNEELNRQERMEIEMMTKRESQPVQDTAPKQTPQSFLAMGDM